MENKFVLFLKRALINRSKTVTRFYILLIIIVASFLRVSVYGSPKLSIATNDTLSYVESSQVPLLSSEMITGRRLLSTNLIYKVFEPKDGYQISVNGSIETHRRRLQHGFDRITILQLVLSIIGWGSLSFVLSEHIRSPLVKYLGSIILMTFAFTPQIADWDSILMSESLTFSLFALQVAITIKLAFSLYKDSDSNMTAWIILWAVICFLWAFIRPTNSFALLITFVILASLLFFKKYRKNKYVIFALLFIAGTFLVGFVTTGSSARSLNYDVYISDFLRTPTRVAILKSWGMPSPDSPSFHMWFQENSTKTLIKFMIVYPGYPITKVIKDFPMAFKEIKQPYFKSPEQMQIREYLTEIGNALHPENTTPFLMDLILLFGFIQLAVKNINNSRPWLWIGIWLFLTAGVTLLLAILGDSWGLSRHALLSTMIYRMFMWMFSIIIIDTAIEQGSQRVLLEEIDSASPGETIS